MTSKEMTEDEVRERAFAMPLHNPAYPPGPYRFVNREYLIIEYRTDPEVLRKLIPAPLELAEPVVKFEFIKMPDSTGFGDYSESGQVIPVTLNGKRGGFVLSMFLNDHPPTAAGRELWGFPKKIAEPELRVHKDTLTGTLDYSDVRVATGTMGFKHKVLDPAAAKSALEAPAFLLKSMPHVDGTPRILELVEYALTDVTVKGSWTGPGALELHPHALAPVADLPVLEVLKTVHMVADVTLPYGKVVHDYLA
jgi:acetoacetate decarboxylase